MMQLSDHSTNLNIFSLVNDFHVADHHLQQAIPTIDRGEAESTFTYKWNIKTPLYMEKKK